MDILALALDGCKTDGAETSVQHARLRSIKAFIDENLANPSLSLGLIAKRNDVSLSYLHHLFKDSGESASEWIWLRRLQRCYEMITLAGTRPNVDHRHRVFDGFQQLVRTSAPCSARRSEYGHRTCAGQGAKDKAMSETAEPGSAQNGAGDGEAASAQRSGEKRRRGFPAPVTILTCLS